MSLEATIWYLLNFNFETSKTDLFIFFFCYTKKEFYTLNIFFLFFFFLSNILYYLPTLRTLKKVILECKKKKAVSQVSGSSCCWKRMKINVRYSNLNAFFFLLIFNMLFNSRWRQENAKKCFILFYFLKNPLNMFWFELSLSLSC